MHHPDLPAVLLLRDSAFLSGRKARPESGDCGSPGFGLQQQPQVVEVMKQQDSPFAMQTSRQYCLQLICP
jgi:hypothetical protein